MVILAGGTMTLLAVIMAYVLGWANKAFGVEVDPRVEQINQVLPGINCGGCGYAGCNEYAEAVVAGQTGIDKCTVGGADCAAAIARILGVELEPTLAYRPIVRCGATYDQRLKQSEYRGEPTCASANIISGVQGCVYGCLGLGDCQLVCDFDAIHMIDGLATVDYAKCIGCGACARVCPRNIISMVPFKAERMVVVACSNRDFGKDVRGVCKVGCIGCNACRKVSELFTVEDNLAGIDYEKYDPQKTDALKAAIEKCPTKCIVSVGKVSENALPPIA